MYSVLLALLALPLLALGQSTASPAATTAAPRTTSSAPATTGNATVVQNQNTTVVFTSVSTSIGLGPGRVETTVVATQLITSVLPVATTNATAGNSTQANATTSASTTTTPSNLPTAPTSVDGGGVGGAPSPGAQSSNGAFGPDDSYIAAATTLAKKAVAVSLVVSMVGGALVVL